ncbi:MAG TPA: ATP-binding protein [Fluviicola sp.]|nr:ATP-binding protein [Fluviicola sp.]
MVTRSKNMEVKEELTVNNVPSSENGNCLMREMEWLAQLIDLRLRDHLGQEPMGDILNAVPAPDLSEFDTFYAQALRDQEITLPERLVLLLALTPHIKPELLDVFTIRNSVSDKRFTEFGGATDSTIAFIPTGETALFLLGGTSLEERFSHYPMLTTEGSLVKKKLVKVEQAGRLEPVMSGKLVIDRDLLHYILTGKQQQPEFNDDFPAKLIHTKLDWEDVVLRSETRESLSEISDWVLHGHTLLKSGGLGKRLKPGYKSLFYGPPGTGKTLTAALIGKSTGHDVYKIDLSMMVSKFIGETEKNLSKVFDLADSKQWILFFDEADALFGKRTEVSSSHDRFANQEVAYLLQRIEDHNGIVILASNLKDNIDQAFTRRFQSVIHFAMPGPEERFTLWRQAFAEDIPLDPACDLRQIADKYEIAGGVIMNVIRYATLKAIKNGDKVVVQSDLETGIRRELQKEGILFI